MHNFWGRNCASTSGERERERGETEKKLFDGGEGRGITQESGRFLPGDTRIWYRFITPII